MEVQTPLGWEETGLVVNAHVDTRSSACDSLTPGWALQNKNPLRVENKW